MKEKSMNEIFLIGKIISNIEFRFIINTKNISIVKFKVETIKDKQNITVIAYNEVADYIYSSLNKNDIVMINGYLENYCNIGIKHIIKIDI